MPQGEESRRDEVGEKVIEFRRPDLGADTHGLRKEREDRDGDDAGPARQPGQSPYSEFVHCNRCIHIDRPITNDSTQQRMQQLFREVPAEHYRYKFGPQP